LSTTTFKLPSSVRDIVSDGISEDVLKRLVLGDILALLSDNDD
jgi:hypothetical protein